MGGGVSKAEYERIRRELLTKELVIRALQDKLEKSEAVSEQPKLTPNMAVVLKASVKTHRLSQALLASQHAGPSVFVPEAGVPEDDLSGAGGGDDGDGEDDGDSEEKDRMGEMAGGAMSGMRNSSSTKHGRTTATLGSDRNNHSQGQSQSRSAGNSHKAMRRVEVSAEVMSKKKMLATHAQRVVHPKNEATTELLTKIMQSNVLFSGQSSGETRDCLDVFEPVVEPAGTVIIQQGDQGEHFYAVERGQLEILVATHGSPAPIRYGFLGPGMGFGELALLCNMPRAATIRAVTDVVLWAIERNTFREIISSHKLMRLNKALQVLQGVSIFNKLTHQELQQVAAAMEWEEYETGTSIIQQGEVGEQFYIITQGEIVVTMRESEHAASTPTPKQIRIMKAGDHFGEMALLKDEVRSATCTAMTHVTCLRLGREHFIAMLGTLQELMDRKPVDTGGSGRGQGSTGEGGTGHHGGTGFSRNGSVVTLDDNASDYKYYMQIQMDELEILQTLGRGAFGRVKLVRHGDSNTPYALKCLVKSYIVENNLKEHVLNEKRVMLSLDHPFILKLYSTYQDSKYLYLLLELALGGELFTYLRRRDRFDEPIAKFYIASVVMVFQHMHSKSIAYRDLKPENILLDNEGFVKLADFGLAKLVTDRTWTLCGTPDYLAPEIILNKGHDKAVDYWALGVLIFELLTGTAPFFAQDPMQIYALIIQGNVKFPVHFSRSCVDLIQKLLAQNPARRLGNMKHGIKDIINHKWFAQFQWDALLAKSLKPPFIPQIRDAFDTSNFEDFRHESEDIGNECEWDPEF